MNVMKVEGFCNTSFELVKQAFVSHFEKGLELGASVCVTREGQPVVDLWAGDAAPDGTPWQRDTIVNVYSTTKTMAAVPLLMLADRGRIDFQAPVADYWPEFAQNGKAGVTVAHVMSHSAGLPSFDPPVQRVEEYYDWDDLCERLAAQEPWWEPGTQFAYHDMTLGYLQGEIVRRVTGKSIGTFFREEVAEPLGADFHIGLAPEHDARVGELVPPEMSVQDLPEDTPPDSIIARMMEGYHHTCLEPQTSAWRRAEIPAAGGFGNARSVARVHAALACGGALDGVKLLSPAGVERVLEEQIRGVDQAIGMEVVWGMGFAINDPGLATRGSALHGAPMSPNRRAFYWAGYGGSLAVVDLDARVSIAYVMNRMSPNPESDLERGYAIAQAAYRSL